ncbi:MAG: N-(5'-phosphoribosyl)anthranilate isomerase [Anaerolineae bacterium]|nr:phosphoribosylanthranilate isomerase [Anaerolineales bacterium]MCQ3976821.1 N-(5'-phosphoribosyl)anthranilate isomerase [Anaerolineae bacterium]
MTKVKICGITNLEDALVAVEAGADLLGFIFYEPSPRYVRPETVREIVSGVKCQVSGDTVQEAKDRDQRPYAPRTTHHVAFVGVFVNSPLDTVAHLLDFCQLDAAQLHGEESPEFVRHFAGRAFKALRPQSPEEAETLIQYYQPPNLLTFQPSNLPLLLLDAYHPNLYGGTGHVTDWEMAASIARRYPIMLAGSLTPENVIEAIRVVQPWGVDVSSGVERQKGRKDHEKVRALVEAVRNVNAVKGAEKGSTVS